MVDMKVIGLVILLLFHSSSGAIQFSYIPHPNNITILQSAVYQCSIIGVQSGDIISLIWIVNGYGSHNIASFQSYIDSVSIIGTGIATHNSTLTIPGANTDLNGTAVECRAQGTLANLTQYSKSDSNTLYIQGDLSFNLTYSISSPLTFNCVWNIPFILPDIDYTISAVIEYQNNVIQQEMKNNMALSEVDHSIEQGGMFGVYTVNVSVSIGELKEIRSANVNMTEVKFSSNITNLTHLPNDDLMANVDVTGLDFEPNKIELQLNSSTRSGNYLVTYNKTDDGVFTGHANITAYMNKMRDINATIVVYYGGIPFYSSNGYHVISTFDTENVTINVPRGLSVNVSEMCFLCSFNPLFTNPRGCYVSYICTVVGADGSASVYNRSKECDPVLVSTYNITVYDIDDNLEPHTEVIVLYDYEVQMMFNENATNGYPTNMTPPVNNTNNTPSSTPTLKTPSYDSGPVVAGAVGVVLVLIILFAIIGVVVFVMYMNRKKSKINAAELTSTSAQQEGNSRLNYIVADINNENRPIPPYPMHNTTFPYVNVQLNTPESVYSTTNHNNGAHCSNDQPEKQYTTIPKQQSTSIPLTYKMVVETVISRIPHKWWKFGENLHIRNQKLLEIQENHPNNDRDAFRDVIDEWQRSESTKRPFNWDTLQMVLTNIGETDIFSKMEESCI